MTTIELQNDPTYRDDLRYIADLPLPWEKMQKKTVLISGATGMIGRVLIDALLYKNDFEGLDCSIVALGRSGSKAKERFSVHWDRRDFHFVQCDINSQIPPVSGTVDYLFHFASSTHPVAYATDPVGTITANVIGTYNLLELAAQRNAERFIFSSSIEVYGQNRGDTEKFDEAYCGYINCNTLRAGYPESKRCGEALCQAFMRQKGVDVVIVRPPRTFGPTMLKSDSKAIGQFVRKAVSNEDIVLKSDGTQLYSFGYVTDVVAGFLYCALKGEPGEAYNIADAKDDTTLGKAAGIVAESVGKRVIFMPPDAVEKEGFSNSLRAVQDGKKLQTLGWHAKYDIKSALEQTVRLFNA